MISIIYRVWLQFNSKRRKQFIYILTLSIVTSLLEVISISAVLPFVAALTSPKELFIMLQMQGVLGYLGIGTPDELLFPMTLLFILLTVFSGIFRILLLWSQTRFSFSIGVDLSDKMYRKSLKKSFSIHNSVNSNKKISDIILKSEMFVDGVILPVMVIISTIFLLTTVVIFVVALDPYAAIYSALGFGLLYLFVSILIKKKLERFSLNILKGQDKVFITLREGFGSIRDIILDKLCNVYSDKFLKVYGLLRRNNANIAIVGSIPRYAIESIGMVIIALLAFNMMTRGLDKDYIFPLLAGVALSAQKILPALQQSFSSWTSLKGSYSSISSALELLESTDQLEHKLEKTYNCNTVFFKESIQFKDVMFTHKGKKILKEVNFKVKKGESIAIIGETGSGKSTLIDLIMGFISPSKGDFLVDGEIVNDSNMGLVPELCG